MVPSSAASGKHLKNRIEGHWRRLSPHRRRGSQWPADLGGAAPRGYLVRRPLLGCSRCRSAFSVRRSAHAKPPARRSWCRCSPRSRARRPRPLSTSTMSPRSRGKQARAPYKPPDREQPAELEALNYDQYRDIRFRPDHAIWRARTAIRGDVLPSRQAERARSDERGRRGKGSPPPLRPRRLQLRQEHAVSRDMGRSRFRAVFACTTR